MKNNLSIKKLSITKINIAKLSKSEAIKILGGTPFGERPSKDIHSPLC